MNSALELGLSIHSTNPVLAPTYDPVLLARAPALAHDIIHLLGLLPTETSLTTTIPALDPETSLPPFPLPTFLAPVFASPQAPLTTYINHLHQLASSKVTAPRLLAHAYVRYLGDLSGGQFIGARVKKSYHLDGVEGTSFYWFDLHGGKAEGREESRGDAKKRLMEVKDWYRRGMDEGVGDDAALKGKFWLPLFCLLCLSQGVSILGECGEWIVGVLIRHRGNGQRSKPFILLKHPPFLFNPNAPSFLLSHHVQLDPSPQQIRNNLHPQSGSTTTPVLRNKRNGARRERTYQSAQCSPTADV